MRRSILPPKRSPGKRISEDGSRYHGWARVGDPGGKVSVQTITEKGFPIACLFASLCFHTPQIVYFSLSSCIVRWLALFCLDCPQPAGLVLIALQLFGVQAEIWLLIKLDA